MKVFTPDDIDGQLRKIIKRTTNNEENNYWKVSFEEGVVKSDVNEDVLPKERNKAENHGFFDIKLIHTQWRYDFAFITPSGI